MEITKALNGTSLGCPIIIGISAGHFVYKLTDKKVKEMIDEGNVLNAFITGAGQMALAVGVGVATYVALRNFDV